jgi:hypothetical protein
MAVQTKTLPAFRAGTPRLLFERVYERINQPMANYAVTPDGQRFLVVKSIQQAAHAQINVVLNWFEDLKQRVPLH